MLDRPKSSVTSYFPDTYDDEPHAFDNFDQAEKTPEEKVNLHPNPAIQANKAFSVYFLIEITEYLVDKLERHAPIKSKRYDDIFFVIGAIKCALELHADKQIPSNYIFALQKEIYEQLKIEENPSTFFKKIKFVKNLKKASHDKDFIDYVLDVFAQAHHNKLHNAVHEVCIFELDALEKLAFFTCNKLISKEANYKHIKNYHLLDFTSSDDESEEEITMENLPSVDEAKEKIVKKDSSSTDEKKEEIVKKDSSSTDETKEETVKKDSLSADETPDKIVVRDDPISAFKQYLLFKAIFYLTGKVKRGSPLHSIRHAHLTEFLDRIDKQKYKSVDDVAASIESIPNQKDGGTNEFVHIVKNAINNRNKVAILQAASLFNIQVIDVRKLLSRARKVLPTPQPSKFHCLRRLA